MKQLDARTIANLDVVLEDTCRALPHGGDHALRRRVAKKLLSTARKGHTTLGRLSSVAEAALADALKRKSTSLLA
jgi:hypothetical protein